MAMDFNDKVDFDRAIQSGHKFITLKSIRNLRAWFKNATVEDISDVIKQLERLKNEKISELELHNNPNAAKQRAYAQAYAKADDTDFIDPQVFFDTIVRFVDAAHANFHATNPKYRFKDLEGNICEWSGQGREPLRLTELLKATNTKREDYLISNPENKVLLDDEDAKALRELGAQLRLANSRFFNDLEKQNLHNKPGKGRGIRRSAETVSSVKDEAQLDDSAAKSIVEEHAKAANAPSIHNKGKEGKPRITHTALMQFINERDAQKAAQDDKAKKVVVDIPDNYDDDDDYYADDADE